jgi:superfamily II DNA or RNA helicase
MLSSGYGFWHFSYFWEFGIFSPQPLPTFRHFRHLEKSGVIELREYQQEAIRAVCESERRGIRRPLIALPTGTGKTVIFSGLINQRPGRSLILVHRDELIRQAYTKLKEIIPALSLGAVKAEEAAYEAPCVIASVQTLARESRLQRLTQDFRTIVVA